MLCTAVEAKTKMEGKAFSLEENFVQKKRVSLKLFLFYYTLSSTPPKKTWSRTFFYVREAIRNQITAESVFFDEFI